MTDTVHLGLPFIEGSQAQKHVTHNEALRILDSVVHIGVLDDALGAPPPSPTEGDRYIVPVGATGAWAGQAQALAVCEDGAWRFFAPAPGWCAWSAASNALLVYDGTAWSAVSSGEGGGGGGSFTGSVDQLGINAIATAPNLLTLKSNAALFAAIDATDGGSGDMRLQISKEGSADTASVIFSDALSGRAEFGLVGSDQFKLKVSDDGLTFTEAMTFDQATGNAAFARGLSLTGIIAPAQITANQNDYNPAGLGAAAVVNLSADAARSLSGLAGGAEGRLLCLINTGSQIISLLDDSAASSAANRFALGGDVALGAKQAVWLRYDGTAARWHALARPAGAGGGGGGREVLTADRTYYVRTDGSDGNTGLANTSGGAFATIQKAVNVALGTLDFYGCTVTIQVADGTYSAGALIGPGVGITGASKFVIKGNSTTPGNVIVAVTGNHVFTAESGGLVTIKDMELRTTTSGCQLAATSSGHIEFANIRFGASGEHHVLTQTLGKVIAVGNYAITGSGQCHFRAISGVIRTSKFTVTLTGTPSFSGAFAYTEYLGLIDAFGMTFSGSATGKRYDASSNGVIRTNGAGGAYFPGNANGATATGGQYL
jgi:hypothetical protein